MPDSPCLANLRELKTSIDEAMKGKKIQSVGHGDRNVAYWDAKIADMIAYYRQLWNQCPEAQIELPELKPLDAPPGARGRPAVRFGRSYV